MPNSTERTLSDDVLRCAYTRITDELRHLLMRCIESAKKARTFGSVFAEPVDYIALQIPDYLEVIKRPMDLSTLKNNLLLGEYSFLYEFLLDMELIFSNCRTYNGQNNDGYYYKAAEEIEKFLVNQLARIDGLEFDFEIYKAITTVPIPVIPDYLSMPLSVAELQVLLRRLAELPEAALTECVHFYLTEKGENPADFKGTELTLKFVSSDSAILRRLDKMVRRKTLEVKEGRSLRTKKAKP
ncbi:Bromodomain-containing protein [Giardia muris]|uniref:Bromodomain-containing protein n=1 Tax=Giardia muris TaxID=5742 RepID=A0A4Z1STL7_GIAMU|nr:Bromodomain-containing protein [Giardia muris]|eukprot:TNJ29266.1 Bromodomain-containing protein [Giardia muris]